jgi:hypothetical protein
MISRFNGAGDGNRTLSRDSQVVCCAHLSCSIWACKNIVFRAPKLQLLVIHFSGRISAKNRRQHKSISLRLDGAGRHWFLRVAAGPILCADECRRRTGLAIRRAALYIFHPLGVSSYRYVRFSS